MKLKNVEGLFVDEDTNSCIGYLIDFKGHGVFSPDGKIEISPEDAKKHNDILSQAELKGLDENCKIGLGGTFYYVDGQVQTFIGTRVDESVIVNGKSITFSRQGKRYRGRLQNDAQCFNFKRIA
jgi:hypothetical protein